MGLPVVACPGISEHGKTGDNLEVNLESGMVKVEKTEMTSQGDRKPEFVLEILRKGDCWRTFDRPFW